jgi:hypothetical protein
LDTRISIYAIGDSSIQIRTTSGEVLFTRVLRSGDRYQVPNRPDLVMNTGDAGALAVYVDGRRMAPIGPSGGGARNVPLDADRLMFGVYFE